MHLGTFKNGTRKKYRSRAGIEKSENFNETFEEVQRRKGLGWLQVGSQPMVFE
jgi:hypothetical protein